MVSTMMGEEAIAEEQALSSQSKLQRCMCWHAIHAFIAVVAAAVAVSTSYWIGKLTYV